MIVKCPSCSNIGEFQKKLPATLRCNKCNASFQVKPEPSIQNDSERVWKVRGATAPDVSLRVLKLKVKAKSLSADGDISRDGLNWIKISSHPAFRGLLTGAEGPSLPDNRKKQISTADGAGRIEPAVNNQIHPPGHGDAVRLKRWHWPASFGLASFALVVAVVSFVPLSNNVERLGSESQSLKEENRRLKDVLSLADAKIEDLEERLLTISSEFDRVKSSSVEFKKTKAVLEDIKKSIDSHKLYLVVSLAEDKVHVKIGTKTLKSYVASTGKGATVLKSTGESYNFLTPRGKMVVKAREREPVWFKPNWAWLEQGLELPSNISLEDRAVEGELGRYRLKLGGGYSIHGTRDGTINGKKETHGCIRMGSQNLKELYTMVKEGTEVYIY